MELPPPRSVRFAADNPDVLSAYTICRKLERRSTNDNDRMHARVLGYLILHAPSLNAQNEIAGQIHDCHENKEVLLTLGEYFVKYFIRPFKKSKGRTPTPSSHPSRPSFDKLKEDLKADIKEAPKNHSQAKVQALIRDGCKCVVTGTYDECAFSSVDSKLVLAAGVPIHTELAHIVPQSTYFNVSSTPGSSSDKKDYSGAVLAVLKRFGYDVERLNGREVHSLHNVMTMEHNVHDYFDRLVMWFESTEVENCYRVTTTPRFSGLSRTVTFTSPDPNKLPCPSPQLLALHAACAKVAHLSGAGEHIDKFDRDADDMDVLATDGTSSEVLTHALLKSFSRPVGVAS